MYLKFTIPFLPPSINQLHAINYSTRKVYLTSYALEFKRNAAGFIPNGGLIKEGTRLKVSVKYFGQFYCKNESIKKKDVQNLDKLLYDVIFEKLGVDDKHVWIARAEKVHSDTEEKTEVEITELGTEYGK